MLLTWFAIAVLPAHARETGTIVLLNAALMDPGVEETTVRVNIVINQGRLELITQDPLGYDVADRIYDVEGGVVLGSLDLGEPASFLVLDGDPRTRVELLLDTKAHARFAVHHGEVLRNYYALVDSVDGESGHRTSGGWLAYSPPPLAVPLNYRDTTRWNRYNGDSLSALFTGALVLDRQRWVDQDAVSLNQVGELSSFDGGDIRGFRLGAVGTLNFDDPWVWVIAGATHAFDKGFDQQSSDDFTVFDLRLDIPAWKDIGFSIGKQKEPISMERLMPMTNLPNQERAAVSDALLPSRNVGMVLSGTLPQKRGTVAGGIFNNWLDKDQPSSLSDNSTQLVTRATWVPLVSANENSLLHLGAGFRYSNGVESGALAAGPEFNSAPDYLATENLEFDSLTTYSMEASMRSGPFWLHGEYLRTEIEQEYGIDPVLDGYHVTASWILSGEVRPYDWRNGLFDGIPIATTVDQNGWGAWELGARYSHLDLDEVAGPGGGGAGAMNIWSMGINWWLSPYFNVNLNYRYITLDQEGDEGISQGVNARLMLVLE